MCFLNSLSQRPTREYGSVKRGWERYPINEFNSQTSPNIHPTVVSPLKLLQLSTISKLKCLPATSAVKRIRMNATV